MSKFHWDRAPLAAIGLVGAGFASRYLGPAALHLVDAGWTEVVRLVDGAPSGVSQATASAFDTVQQVKAGMVSHELHQAGQEGKDSILGTTAAALAVYGLHEMATLERKAQALPPPEQPHQ